MQLSFWIMDKKGWGSRGDGEQLDPGAIFAVDKTAVFSGHKFMHISKLN